MDPVSVIGSICASLAVAPVVFNTLKQLNHARLKRIGAAILEELETAVTLLADFYHTCTNATRTDETQWWKYRAAVLEDIATWLAENKDPVHARPGDSRLTAVCIEYLYFLGNVHGIRYRDKLLKVHLGHLPAVQEYEDATMNQPLWSLEQHGGSKDLYPASGASRTPDEAHTTMLEAVLTTPNQASLLKLKHFESEIRFLLFDRPCWRTYEASIECHFAATSQIAYPTRAPSPFSSFEVEDSPGRLNTQKHRNLRHNTCWHIYTCILTFASTSTTFGVVWSIVKGDVSGAFTVAGFILCFGAIIFTVLLMNHNDACVARQRHS